MKSETYPSSLFSLMNLEARRNSLKKTPNATPAN